MATAQHVISTDEEEIANDGEPFCVCLSGYTRSLITAHLALHCVGFSFIFSHFSSDPLA